jgi:diaminohydroxyphosphoribosylaminopyrimidine deaminase/5-amino-6-(5-phosphoribosylamino)uracil reductase
MVLTPKPDSELDRRLMAATLRLGRRNLGRTWPNPAVGALIARMEGGRPVVVGRGWTAEGGRPHAETIALAEAGDAARGATVYVSLEPCAHIGRTPPCADALVAAGVGRVVYAIGDPDPRVNGAGRAALEKAGIGVTAGVLAEEATRAHAGHIARITKGRPYAILKLAVSADGMIGRRAGERMMITGKPALEVVQTMRAECDAVAVGIGTVLIDDPRLTVRLPGLGARSPARIVFDATARLPLASRLVASAREVPVLAVVGPEAPEERRDALADAGVRIVAVGSGAGGVDIAAALQAFGGEGYTRLLFEGGAQIASSLVSGDLVDEVVFFRASVVVGADGVRALGGLALSAIERSPRFRQIEAAIVGDDTMRRYERAA